MLSLLAMAIAATPPTGFSTTVERVDLVRAGTEPVSAEVNSLSAHIILRGATLAPKAARHLCPQATTKRGVTTLTCTTRQLWAEINQDKTGLFLDVRQLRGVLPGDTTLALRPWPLRAMSIPDACPGTLAGARGECALAAGKFDLARREFVEALSGPDSNLAHLRLGDFALAEGKLEDALAHYSAPAYVGPIGRVAKARACDLKGSCFTGPEAQSVDTVDNVVEPIKTELELHFIRRRVATGQLADAMAFMAKRVEQPPALCTGVALLCQNLVRAGLEADDDTTRSNALKVYLEPDVRNGPIATDLALSAAAAAEAMGAPGFAATLLASVSATMAPFDLDEHYLKIAQLYLAAHDQVRASFILEYADGRLGRRTGAGWPAVRAALGKDPSRAARADAKPAKAAVDLAQLSTAGELSTELARAAAVRSRAVADSAQEPTR